MEITTMTRSELIAAAEKTIANVEHRSGRHLSDESRDGLMNVARTARWIYWDWWIEDKDYPQIDESCGCLVGTYMHSRFGVACPAVSDTDHQLLSDIGLEFLNRLRGCDLFEIVDEPANVGTP